MPTRLDDATIRVRLIVDDETERRGRQRTLGVKRREQASRRPFVDPAKARKKANKEKEKIATERRQDLIKQARAIRAPVLAVAGATRAALAKPQLAKKVAGAAIGAVAIAKLIEEIIPILTTVIVASVNKLLQEASGGTLSLGDSGIKFIDGVANLVTDAFAAVRAAATATGRTFSEAEARARLSQAVHGSVPSLDFGELVEVGIDVFKIEKAKRSAEQAIGRENRQNFARKATEALIDRLLKGGK